MHAGVRLRRINLHDSMFVAYSVCFSSNQKFLITKCHAEVSNPHIPIGFSESVFFLKSSPLQLILYLIIKLDTNEIFTNHC